MFRQQPKQIKNEFGGQINRVFAFGHMILAFFCFWPDSLSVQSNNETPYPLCPNLAGLLCK